MKLQVFCIILLFGFLAVGVRAQTPPVPKTSTELMLENIKVDDNNTLYVYCFAPPTSARPTMKVFRTGNPDWIREGLFGADVRHWIRYDFLPPKSGWGSRVTAVCRSESEFAKLFVYIGKQPLDWNKIKESSYGFLPELVGPSTKSGDFFYEVPWPSDVKIDVFRERGDTWKPALKSITAHWGDKGEKRTPWKRRFNEMVDGHYKAVVSCKQTDGDKNGQKIHYVDVYFKRGIKGTP